MAKYLITGGAGFIGSTIANTLLAQGQTVVVVDDLSMGQVQNLNQSDQLHFLKHSITDHDFINDLLDQEKFDYILLVGAVASVADSIAEPGRTHAVNAEANFNILEHLRKEKLPLKNLLFISSAAVYGNLAGVPKNELSPVEPATQYAVDKYSTERNVINYHNLYGMPTVAVRLFNIYGPKQNPKSPYSGVLSIITDCLMNDKSFKQFGDGEQVRDFTYVTDVVNCILALLEDSRALGEVVNIGTGQKATLNEVITIIEDITGHKLKKDVLPERKGDIKYSYGDPSKLNDLGLVAKVDLKTGLRKYWEYLLENREH
ncbi:NAD-dependent epimerase/dehydratase family protein [Xylocopilactobacillus apicola]|uniref:Epimerase n=1 Tax=Xylocopilactobacillus apicola TaxID=2932184 RepID=A0AAU9D5Z5_9LACO|nr:NAD-dependent epimerase/dehydratase family protein [Xylocopilactobacillus apicola]BDR59244.1 epimerase [Xylocopilactobacillus apicola]